MKNIKTVRTKATVDYRGHKRPIIVEIDKETGLIAVRLKRCSTRRHYNAKDLFQPVPPQLSLPL